MTRFPEDFMFQLTKEEVELVKSQFVTSRNINYFEGQEGGRRKLPYAFTEQGIYMLATVLRGELAEQQSIFIMRTFREMRHYISQNQQFVTRNEMELLTAKVGTITERQDRMEKRVEFIQKDVTILGDNFITDKDKKDFVIYKGQKLEADIAYIEIYHRQINQSMLWMIYECKIITTPFTESRWRGSCFIHREWKRWERISYELFSDGFSK